MPVFGQKSIDKLETCHPDIQKVMWDVIAESEVDFGITHGHRNPEIQFDLFKKGRAEQNGQWVIVNKKEVVTYKDGYEKLSKHNEYPSKAVDIAVYLPGVGYSWDKNHLAYVAGIVMTKAKQLLNDGLISHTLVWGGNWDSDGTFQDHTLIDFPHFQI